MANEYVYTTVGDSPGSNKNFMYQDTVNEYFDTIRFGLSSETLILDGAIRFTNIPIDESVVSAELKIYVNNKGSGTGGNLKVKVFGIDEDNTAVFSSNPLGRDHTSEYVTYTGAMADTGQYMNFGVTNIVNEIISRPGWSSGNAIGFILEDNESSNNYWISDFQTTQKSYLVISMGEPDFTPAPKSIDAPTFPDTTSHGIKISQTGIDVMDATEAQLLFTTRKKPIKVVLEQELTDFGLLGNGASLEHGLSYAPCCLGFLKESGNCRKLNYGYPDNKTKSAYLKADTSELLVQTINITDKTAYVYVFIDPLLE